MLEGHERERWVTPAKHLCAWAGGRQICTAVSRSLKAAAANYCSRVQQARETQNTSAGVGLSALLCWLLWTHTGVHLVTRDRFSTCLHDD